MKKDECFGKPVQLPAGAAGQGLIWGIMAIGVYITYKYWMWPI